MLCDALLCAAMLCEVVLRALCAGRRSGARNHVAAGGEMGCEDSAASPCHGSVVVVDQQSRQLRPPTGGTDDVFGWLDTPCFRGTEHFQRLDPSVSNRRGLRGEIECANGRDETEAGALRHAAVFVGAFLRYPGDDANDLVQRDRLELVPDSPLRARRRTIHKPLGVGAQPQHACGTSVVAMVEFDELCAGLEVLSAAPFFGYFVVVLCPCFLHLQ
mmetsp:Transcript_61281/g.133134  ORF Transcript_61281/g.133134 Transcript_61281/m.133134 type:complete len:216 (-) Transcript_61281:31-678(-)